MSEQQPERYERRALFERDALIAVLSKVWPSHLMRHPNDDAAWFKSHSQSLIVCVHSPAGRLAWHIADEDAPRFAHLKMRDHEWIPADGAERYERLLAWNPSDAPTSVSQLTGRMGGKARAENMTAARRSESARSAALTRWAGHATKRLTKRTPKT